MFFPCLLSIPEQEKCWEDTIGFVLERKKEVKNMYVQAYCICVYVCLMSMCVSVFVK